MSAPKHTPGPWSVRSRVTTGDIVAPTGTVASSVLLTTDAHLIAAAPDMLEALDNLVTAYLGSSDPILQINAAVAAIKKARGEK